MSYNINIPKSNLPLFPKDIIEWIEQQGWQHMQEWRWFYPHIGQNADFIFQFDNEEHAVWFKLRWA